MPVANGLVDDYMKEVDEAELLPEISTYLMLCFSSSTQETVDGIFS